MSLAMSAAPVAVRRPATAQLLLPAAGARATLPDAGAAAPALRTSSTSAEGTGGCAAGISPSDAGTAGASQLVPAGYRKPRPHFLRVHETGGVREVQAVGGLDGGHAARIARDAHGSGEAYFSARTVQARQRGTQQPDAEGERSEQEHRSGGAGVLQRPHARAALSPA